MNQSPDMNVIIPMKKNFFLFTIILFLLAPYIKAEDAPVPPPAKIVKIKWYGQSFVTLISSVGIRIAIDPFDNKTNRYPLPVNIPMDIVLVSNEDDDHNNTDFIAGNPIIFRSSTGEGTNRGNGIIFKGTPGIKDETSTAQIGNKSMIYTFSLDGVKFCHLGNLGQKSLKEKQLQQIGAVDVLILPIGDSDREELLAQIKPKIVIPIHYKTPLTVVPLYSVEDFVKNKPVKRFPTNEISISKNDFPPQMEVWLYANPPEKIPELIQP